jgi:BON domain
MPNLFRWLPIGRAAAALWAWRNRRELTRWLGFAWRAVPPSSAGREDLVTEARLRAALAADERTRGVPSLAVRVRDGEATLDGRLSAELHDLVYEKAAETKGVRTVDCRIGDRRSRGEPRAHVHTARASARSSVTRR